MKLHKLFTIKLIKIIRLKLTNESLIDTIIHITKIKIMINGYKKQIWLFVTLLFNFDIILNMSWLKKHNSNINYVNHVMLFNSNHCCVNYNSFFEIISTIEFKLRFRKKKFKKQFSNIKSIKNYDINHFLTYSFLKITRKKNYEVVVMWFEHFEIFNKSVEQNKYFLINIFINKIAIIIVENYEKFFNKFRKKFMSRKKFRIYFF